MLIRSWQDAEHIVLAWLIDTGFSDAVGTGEGSDGGVDVHSSAVVAQVKAHMGKIGRPEVQQLFGIAAASSRLPLFFSLAGFTQEAMAWAEETGVCLFSFDLQSKVEPLNSAARSLRNDRTSKPVANPSNSSNDRIQTIRRLLLPQLKDGLSDADHDMAYFQAPAVAWRLRTPVTAAAVARCRPLARSQALLVLTDQQLVVSPLQPWGHDAKVTVMRLSECEVLQTKRPSDTLSFNCRGERQTIKGLKRQLIHHRLFFRALHDRALER